MIVEFALAVALMGGSDDPTPYTVDESGITLPAGQVFEDNGHVNVRTESGTAIGLHFEGKCKVRTDAECAGARHDAAQFIGTSFIPWSAFGIEGCDAVVWVQLSDFNEHFGEGGQVPVIVAPCHVPPTLPPVDPPTTPPAATPTPTESPVASPEPSDIPGASSLPETGGPDWGWLVAAAVMAITGGLLVKRFPELNRGDKS